MAYHRRGGGRGPLIGRAGHRRRCRRPPDRAAEQPRWSGIGAESGVRGAACSCSLPAPLSKPGPKSIIKIELLFFAPSRSSQQRRGTHATVARGGLSLATPTAHLLHPPPSSPPPSLKPQPQARAILATMAPHPLFSNFAAALSTMQPKQQQADQQQQQQQKRGVLGSLPAAVSAAINSPAPGKVVPAAPSEPGKIAMYSPEYYYTCALGGIASCGLTHTAVTPLDVVKCNMQTDPAKYKGIRTGFSIVLKEQGPAGLMRGWLPTLMGYSAQGAFKFGLVRPAGGCVVRRRAAGSGALRMLRCGCARCCVCCVCSGRGGCGGVARPCVRRRGARGRGGGRCTPVRRAQRPPAVAAAAAVAAARRRELSATRISIAHATSTPPPPLSTNTTPLTLPTNTTPITLSTPTPSTPIQHT